MVLKKHTTVQRTAKLGTGASDEKYVSVLNRLASVLVDQNARRVTVKPDPRPAGSSPSRYMGPSAFGQVVLTLTERPTAYFDYRPLVSKAQDMQLTSAAGIYTYIYIYIYI